MAPATSSTICARSSPTRGAITAMRDRAHRVERLVTLFDEALDCPSGVAILDAEPGRSSGSYLLVHPAPAPRARRICASSSSRGFTRVDTCAITDEKSQLKDGGKDARRPELAARRAGLMRRAPAKGEAALAVRHAHRIWILVRRSSRARRAAQACGSPRASPRAARRRSSPRAAVLDDWRSTPARRRASRAS